MFSSLPFVATMVPSVVITVCVTRPALKCFEGVNLSLNGSFSAKTRMPELRMPAARFSFMSESSLLTSSVFFAAAAGEAGAGALLDFFSAGSRGSRAGSSDVTSSFFFC